MNLKTIQNELKELCSSIERTENYVEKLAEVFRKNQNNMDFGLWLELTETANEIAKALFPEIPFLELCEKTYTEIENQKKELEKIMNGET